jgi:hypothetical protein
VWIGAAPGVAVDASAGQFAATALSTLIGDGRASKGQDVHIASADVVSALPALITPPSDPVRLGAANRTLARLGVPWRYAALQTASTIVRGGRLDGVAVSSRYRLQLEGAGNADTLATAGGEPWIVAGPGYVLSASRLDPAVTNLPVRAAFVPWLADMVGLRLGAQGGDVTAPIIARPGASIQLPPTADAIENASGSRRSISPEHAVAPSERGVWFVLHGPRRIGAIVVNAAPEESRLARLTPEMLAPRLAGTRARGTASASRWIGDSLAAGSRKPALVPLLMFALLLLAAEALVVRSTRSAAA